MLSFDETAAYLDGVADSLPQPLTRDLNGGINLLPDAKKSAGVGGMYILGEYINSHQMGRYIVIYYGSFLRVCAGLGDDAFRKRLREVLIHELTHHNQSLAGNRDLEIKDEIQRRHFLETGEYVPTRNIELRKRRGVRKRRAAGRGAAEKGGVERGGAERGGAGKDGAAQVRAKGGEKADDEKI